MRNVQKLKLLSVEDYLKGETKGNVRHEFVSRQIYAMVGASNWHNILAGAIYIELRQFLKKPCQAYMSDMKVRVGDDFYYPDVVVSCKPVEGVFYFVDEPTVIVEVLSPSTERQDRLEKRIAYQRLTSLQEYLLITQDKIQIEIFRRATDGWELEIGGEGDTIMLSSLGFQIAVNSLYEDLLSNPP